MRSARVAASSCSRSCASAAPATAHAGTYDVRACGASSAQAFTLSNESPLTINTGSQCPQSGSQLLSGMFAGVSNSGFTLARAGASWTIAAPAGLQLDRLDVKRALGRVSAAWQVTASTPAKVLEACDESDPAVCRLGSAGGEQVAYTDLHAPSVTFRLECHPPAPDDDLACVGRNNTQAWVAIYNATARVETRRRRRSSRSTSRPAGTTAPSRSTVAASRCERDQVAERVRRGDEAVRARSRRATTRGCSRARRRARVGRARHVQARRTGPTS